MTKKMEEGVDGRVNPGHDEIKKAS